MAVNPEFTDYFVGVSLQVTSLYSKHKPHHLRITVLRKRSGDRDVFCQRCLRKYSCRNL